MLFFIGDSTDGSVYKEIILDIIRRSHDVGLHVTNVTSDMGSPNRAMWSSFGISVTQHQTPIFYIPHPIEPHKNLYFLADIPHVIKNCKASLLKNDMRFQTQIISIKPIKALVDHDEERALKLAPSLKRADITPSHFLKMKVSSAMHVISRSVSAGILTMVDQGVLRPDMIDCGKSTAWFVDLMNGWFDLACSRHPVLGLSKANPEKYQQALEYFDKVVGIIRQLQVGNGQWKPWQTGIMLSTLSIMSLTGDLLETGIPFVLTGRFSQDCLENLFSTVRLRSPTPSAVEFRNTLKIITVAQYLKTPTQTSYDNDDSSYLADYLQNPTLVGTDEIDSQPSEVVILSPTKKPVIDGSELNALYYLGGWSLKVLPKDCENCKSEAIDTSASIDLLDFQRLTLHKEFRTNSLRHPSAQVFKLLQDAEKLFRVWEGIILEVDDVLSYLKTRILSAPEVSGVSFNCKKHDIKPLIIEKFLRLRLHISCHALTKHAQVPTASLSSKSMAMRHLANKIK